MCIDIDCNDELSRSVVRSSQTNRFLRTPVFSSFLLNSQGSFEYPCDGWRWDPFFSSLTAVHWPMINMMKFERRLRSSLGALYARFS